MEFGEDLVVCGFYEFEYKLFERCVVWIRWIEVGENVIVFS